MSYFLFCWVWWLLCSDLLSTLAGGCVVLLALCCDWMEALWSYSMSTLAGGFIFLPIILLF